MKLPRCTCLLLLLIGCVRPPVPTPIPVSPVVPTRLTPRHISINGQVLDSATRTPVAGVEVQGYFRPGLPARSIQSVLNTGGEFSAWTDAQGRFVYNGVVTRTDTGRFLLFVASLAYSGRTWCPVAPAAAVTMLLRRNPPFVLPSDSCHTSAADRVFNTQAPRWGTQAPFTAWYIDNSQSRTETKLRSVILQGTPVEGLFDRGPLYFQLFAVDPNTGGPGKELFTEETYVTFPRPGKVTTYDLAPYDIVIPPGSFYLVMGSMESGNLAWHLSPMEQYHPSGRLLQAPCTFAESRSWQYAQGHWQPTPRSQNTWPLFERLVTLEVVPR